MNILLSTGEVSGDRIGAELAGALREAAPNICLWGIGGRQMHKAGVEIIYNSSHLGSVGVSETLITLPAIFQSFQRIRCRVSKCKPDIAILIGHEVFNFLLSRWLRTRKILTVSYFPPQIWLWKRVTAIFAKSYDLILTSFLDEEKVYRQAGGQTVFVGHYLRDEIKMLSPDQREEAKRGLNLGGRRII